MNAPHSRQYRHLSGPDVAGDVSILMVKFDHQVAVRLLISRTSAKEFRQLRPLPRLPRRSSRTICAGLGLLSTTLIDALTAIRNTRSRLGTKVEQMQQQRPVMLVILDGFGWREDAADNALRQAKPPIFGRLWEGPHGFLHTSGNDVGLPQGQMGNSEVGHLNIGAG